MVDDNLFDVYIQTVDQIDGPSNVQKVNSYVLINGFSVDSGNLINLYSSLSNYWVSSVDILDGRTIPTMLVIQG
jgi:hypothetical protein